MMLLDQKLNNLKNLFSHSFKDEFVDIVQLPESGSSRKYYRIKGKNKSVLGVYYDNNSENKAFIYFSNFFKEKGINVPSVYAEDLKNNVYLNLICVFSIGFYSFLGLQKRRNRNPYIFQYFCLSMLCAIILIDFLCFVC